MDKSKSISFNDRRSREKHGRFSKSSSFSVHLDRHVAPPLRTLSPIEAVWDLPASEGNVDGGSENVHPSTLEELSKEIDGLVEKLSSVEDKSDLFDMPREVLTFSKMVQSEIEKYDVPESILRFGQDIDQDSTLINGLKRVAKLSNLLGKFSCNEKLGPALSATTLVVQRAMTFMEEELRILLEDSMVSCCKLDSKDMSSDGEKLEDKYPIIDEEIISNMRKIASSMISCGYETECCQVYSVLRRNAFKEAMLQQGFEKISIDEVQRMQWESLEGHIVNWIKVVKYVAKVLLPGEKKLCDSVFSNEHPSIGEAMFSNLARSAVILFLNFAEAISMTKRAAERLFKVLDVYDTLTELISAIDELCSNQCALDLRSELSSVRRRLGEAAVCIFCDLENSIKNDIARNLVPGGAVHPLTRYTMNYLWYTCDFKNTLEEVFSLHQSTEQNLDVRGSRTDNGNENSRNEHNQSEGIKQTPFTTELMTVMSLLDENLEAKSKLYKDPSLRFIFLMNNGRYILQKIKESADLHSLLGNDFRRKRSSDLRGYHKSYQRETWSRVLQCLNQEGLQINGKVQKPVLKERFKSFNQMFDEIHKTQSSWVVSDEQLQSELRVSISAVMIPAYRSFLARFGQHITAGRQYEKYIKYQPEDIETTIEGLFDGNQNVSMARRKN
ncbi:exocyst complex component EXO70B1-like [Amaranthus tricolor]|uniref:exocyst complex component EXO70B1-like n=1 Tax=Amaranthus tricolor TaxID=29722 RepID=UPI00258C1CC8|nr:exocyst complex component EXO70B1-like [Amaranthus tricolor]